LLILYNPQKILCHKAAIAKAINERIIETTSIPELKKAIKTHIVSIKCIIYCTSLTNDDYNKIKAIRKFCITPAIILISNVFEGNLLKKLSNLGLHNIFDHKVDDNQIKKEIDLLSQKEFNLKNILAYRQKYTYDTELLNYFQLIKKNPFINPVLQKLLNSIKDTTKKTTLQNQQASTTNHNQPTYNVELIKNNTPYKIKLY